MCVHGVGVGQRRGIYSGEGTLIVGITDFAPMDYKDENGEWIGFDADMARKVAEKLGVEAQFVEIDWDNKIMELDSKNIDVVWNGMTLTSEVTSSMECTNPYCNNAPVRLIRDHDDLRGNTGITVCHDSFYEVAAVHG